MNDYTVSDAVAVGLKKFGVEFVFGIPGSHLAAIYDALFRVGGIKIITNRHEQASGFMALGYAKATRKAGVCLTIPGPGLLNITAALATARACNLPIVCISGQINSEWLDKGLGCLHEVKNQLSCVEAFTKWRARITNPSETFSLLEEAFEIAQSGRQGPVVLEIPADVAFQKGASLERKPKDTSRDESSVSAESLKEMAQALINAKRPLIIAGSGAQDCGKILEEISQKLCCPIVVSENGRNIIKNDYKLLVHPFFSEEFWMDADVIMAVGTRLSQQCQQRERSASSTLIRIDIDASQLNYPVNTDIKCCADAREILPKLLAEIAELPQRKSDDIEVRVADIRRETQYRLKNLQPQAAFCEALERAIAPDAAICLDSTQIAYYASYATNLFHSQLIISSGYQGTMGNALPSALGIKIGNPNRQTIAIVGDGGFLISSQELAAAIQFNIPIVVLLFNDNAYGEFRRMQNQRFEGRQFGSDIYNPDFVAYAKSFGCNGVKVSRPAELEAAVREALKSKIPTVIEISVQEMSSIGTLFEDSESS